MSRNFQSINPVNGNLVWEGAEASRPDVDAAVRAARAAFDGWRNTTIDERILILRRFTGLVDQNRSLIAQTISEETGKVMWDALGEPGAMVSKVDISIRAYGDRTGGRIDSKGAVRTRLTHKPHGVMAVFGPFNFPAHLPNGHIVPALLAGNTIVFKPSELTPKTAEVVSGLWQQAGIPDGVLNVVQGGADVGRHLVANEDLNGVLFTGSVATGKAISKALVDRPGVIVALELGGNNPLVFENAGDLEAASFMTIQSAFISAGQRCTCARRLIVPTGSEQGEKFIETLLATMDRIKVGLPDARDEPFMGSMVSSAAAQNVLNTQDKMARAGGEVLRSCKELDMGPAFLSPGLIDVTAIKDRDDAECFGPLLQLIRVDDFEAAVKEANNTRFGLSAGLFSENQAQYDYFLSNIRAGIVNWNQPLTGASGAAPFGGVGDSGNNRPAAYYAADYCAYPVASLEQKENRVATMALPKGISP